MPDAILAEMLAFPRKAPDGAMACPTKFIHLCNYIGTNDWRRFYLAILFGLIVTVRCSHIVPDGRT